MSTYAIWNRSALSWVTYQGRVLVHDNPGELGFLFPGSTVRPINGVPTEDCLPIQQHPQCQHYTFPLRREDFW